MDHRQIQREIDRLKVLLDDEPAPSHKDHTNLLVGATIVIAIVAVAAIVSIFAVRPDKDNGTIIATIVSVLVPVMTALLAAAVREVHAAVNSRLTQLLEVTALKSRAEGVLAQRETQRLELAAHPIVPFRTKDK
jgi:uncharacterized membrane protein